MGGLGGVISNLLSLGGSLLPFVSQSVQAPSSSSSPPVKGRQMEAELKALMRMLKRINETLYDAERREIVDRSVKHWLKELKKVAYDAENVLDEYRYEVLRAQVEARKAPQPDSLRNKLIQMPEGMFDRIKDIKDMFDEIDQHRKALKLSDDDGRRCCNSDMQIYPTSHFVIESDIFGRDEEKEELISMLSSDCHDGDIVCVVTIVGTGGLGKTTLAQLVYNDQRMKQRFDKCSWICVSEDWNVQRLTTEVIESITGSICGLTNLSALQNKIMEEIRGQKVLLVLDNMWNEDKDYWELFRGPFMLAKEAKILVTTWNESVAKIMQTVPTFKLGYMLNEHCWRLFKRYAFGDVTRNEDSRFAEIGKKILEKCGKLPLAIKSIASLLRHEAEEENWINILESEIWNSDKLRNEILKPLQISYARLPTHLKPCLLYCSLFPKDHTVRLKELVQLWISQDYIKGNENENPEKIGQEYAKELWQRSFLEGRYWELEFILADSFKLHDLVHDLARYNSGSGCYSIETGKIPKFPEELHHLYIGSFVEVPKTLPSVEVTSLRTLIVSSTCDMEDPFCHFVFSKAFKLRALKFNWFSDLGYEYFFSVGHLKHLRYLSLTGWPLPEHLSSLYFLRNLTLKMCDVEELSESIVNLVSLEELVIDNCWGIKRLLNEIGSLKNVQNLKICGNGVRSLPASLAKIIGNVRTLQLGFGCNTIGWLKDFVNLNGTLIIEKLSKIASLDDAQCANLVSMHNLECLILSWNYSIRVDEDENSHFQFIYPESNQVHLQIIGNTFLCSDKHFSLMALLQPHPNLRELRIDDYPGVVFPDWVGNPTSCALLKRIVIENCKNLESFPFGNLCKLRYLEINRCDRLRLLGAESLPLELQELEIDTCKQLISMPGKQKLKSLVKLSIGHCRNLQSLVMGKSDLESKLPYNSRQKYLLGLRYLTSLRILKIERCLALEAFRDEPRPMKSCGVRIYNCPGLRSWCLEHGIPHLVGGDLLLEQNRLSFFEENKLDYQ